MNMMKNQCFSNVTFCVHFFNHKSAKVEIRSKCPETNINIAKEQRKMIWAQIGNGYLIPQSRRSSWPNYDSMWRLKATATFNSRERPRSLQIGADKAMVICAILPHTRMRRGSMLTKGDISSGGLMLLLEKEMVHHSIRGVMRSRLCQQMLEVSLNRGYRKCITCPRVSYKCSTLKPITDHTARTLYVHLIVIPGVYYKLRPIYFKFKDTFVFYCFKKRLTHTLFCLLFRHYKWLFVCLFVCLFVWSFCFVCLFIYLYRPRPCKKRSIHILEQK